MCQGFCKAHHTWNKFCSDIRCVRSPRKAFRVNNIDIKINIGKFSMKTGECIYNVSMNFSEVVLVNVYSIFLNEKQYLQSCKWSGVKIMHKVFKSLPQSEQHVQNWTACESNLHRGFRNQVQHLQIISEDLYAKKVVRLVGIKRSQISVKIDYYCFYSVPPTGDRILEAMDNILHNI